MSKRPSDYSPDPDSELKFRRVFEIEREMEARGPKKTLWDNNEVQFARLIEELQAAGVFTPAVLDTLKGNMDLDLVDLHEIISRAQNVFDTSKAKLVGGTGEADREEFMRCVWNLADLLDIDDWNDNVSPIVTMLCTLRGWDYSQMFDDYTRRRNGR